jgi:hypothetical protein
MPDITRTAIREPAEESPRQYARRVYALASLYAVLFVASLAGIALLVWKAQLFVGLTQHSNVETLTLAFFVVLFGYIAIISAGGTLGAAHIAHYWLLTRLGHDRAAIERRKVKALGPPGEDPPLAALNVILELETRPSRPSRSRSTTDSARWAGSESKAPRCATWKPGRMAPTASCRI